MSEKQFERCSLQEATHIEVNGVRHELNDNVQYFRNGDLLGIRWRDEYTFIPEELFSTFGINPMKEKKQEPIEFEADFAKYAGDWYQLHTLDHEASYLHNKKAKFKCVEILEDEK